MDFEIIIIIAAIGFAVLWAAVSPVGAQGLSLAIMEVINIRNYLKYKDWGSLAIVLVFGSLCMLYALATLYYLSTLYIFVF